MIDKISIVMSYFNRKNLLINTLESIKNYNVEVIIVDDASNDINRIDNLDLPLNAKVIRIDKKNKKHTNPCVPYNIGFKNTTGDIIIIQNPECLHMGNIIDHVNQNLSLNDYFSYGTYSLDKATTAKINSLEHTDNYLEKIKEIMRSTEMCPMKILQEGGVGWYNHSVFRPVAYHFVSAIHRHHLIEMGGFDEKYAFGISYDDDELLHRIKLKGLNVKIINEPFALHQHHSTGRVFDQKLVLKNARLLIETKKRKKWKVYNSMFREIDV